MKNKEILTVWHWGLLSLTLLSQEVLAGPGGHFASTIFDSFWGKILLVVLVIIFLPLIILKKINLFRIRRRTAADLMFMSQFNRNFDWTFAKGRVEACFNRVYQGWGKADLEDARHWMTDWYCQNQQQTVLDSWQQRGLENICVVKEISSISPLGVVNRNHAQSNEDSLLLVSITANMQDYLQEKATGKLIEGSKEFKLVTNVWTFRLVQGHWLVERIDAGPSMFQYATLLLKNPDIRSTVPA